MITEGIPSGFPFGAILSRDFILIFGARISDVPPKYTNELLLLAFLSKAEFAGSVSKQLFHNQDTMALGLRKLEAIQPEINGLLKSEAGICDEVSVRPVPPAHNSILKSITDNPLFRRCFQLLPISIGLIEIDKLIAPQRILNMDYVDRITESINPDMTLDELISFCLSPQKVTSPVEYLESGPNAYMFSSPNADLRFLGSYVKYLSEDEIAASGGGGMPVAAVVTLVGFGSNPINVIRYRDRYILHNGFHRVYALRKAGITEIPIVIQAAGTLPEFPRQLLSISRELLTQSPRPPLMKDFLVERFTMHVEVKSRLRTVSVQTGGSAFDVPSH